MKLSFVIFVSYSLTTFTKCSPVKSKQENDLDFMRQMGLMQNTNDTKIQKEIVEQFQQMLNMTVTGILDEKTKYKMKNMPRCVKPKNVPVLQVLGQWPKSYLQYKFVNYSSEYNMSSLENLVYKGMKLWVDVSNLILEKVPNNSNADITIQFVNESHIPSANENEQIIAYAAPPGDGRIFYVENLSKFGIQVDLESVTAHEFGHTLGFVHNDNMTSIMFPMYIPRNEIKLNKIDIIGVQALYGKKYSLCDKGKIDAVVYISEKKIIYVFKGPQVWKFVSGKLVKNYPALLSQEFPGLRNGVNACFDYNNYLYFIQGKNVLKFNGTFANYFDTLELEYDAAVTIGERLYTFKGSEYWRYDINDNGMTKIRKSYPRLINKLWKGVPENIDAIYYDYDVHFFKRKKYYRFDANILENPAVEMNISEWEGCKKQK